MARHLGAKTSIGLAALTATIAGCSLLDDLGNDSESVEAQPTSSVPPEPYQAVMLDGSTITIFASEGTLGSFTEGIPTAIHSLNVLAQAGNCRQIKNDSESWTAKATDGSDGKVASAFANHANSIYKYIECGKAAQPVVAVAVQDEVRYESCTEAIAADGGNYLFGIDPEYTWYEDRDGDGVVCENR